MYVTAGILNNEQAFYIRYLNLEDLPSILKLQSKVVGALPNPELLQPLTTGEFTNILNDESLMIGIFIDRKMIAFRAMLVPENDEEGLGADIGLSEKAFPSLIYSEISNVDPDYRGNGLQTYMGKLLVNNINLKQFQYILATVAPSNIPSIKDKFSLGMEIAVLKEKYGGKLRFLFVKDLYKETRSNVSADVQKVKNDNLEQQQALLMAGYRGVSMEKIDNEWYVCLVK